jgi:hypothetical protein
MSTIFNRQDFIERSRHFIPVYVDGDSPNAQKEGARFKVSGYPTMVLFTADGVEITRLPGEVDPDRYMTVLTESMNGAKPVKATLAAALGQAADRAKLAPGDWRMLAYYSWITDEQQLAPEKDLPRTLARLAKACPADQTDTATRLELMALAAASQAKTKPAVSKGAADVLIAVLADDKRARDNFDLLASNAGSIAGYVAPASSPARTRLDRRVERGAGPFHCRSGDRNGRSPRRRQREDRARAARRARRVHCRGASRHRPQGSRARGQGDDGCVRAAVGDQRRAEVSAKPGCSMNPTRCSRASFPAPIRRTTSCWVSPRTRRSAATRRRPSNGRKRRTPPRRGRPRGFSGA